MSQKNQRIRGQKRVFEASGTVHPLAPGIGKRIEEAINVIGTRKKAARASGVSVESLRRYTNESARPSFEAMAGLANASGYSLEWLATGQPDPASVIQDNADDPYSPGIHPVHIRNAVRLVERRMETTTDIEHKARLIAEIAADLQAMDKIETYSGDEMTSAGTETDNSGSG